MNKTMLSKDELLYLYELQIKNQNEIREKWRKNMNFYITTILTMISVMFALIKFFEKTYLNKYILFFSGTLVITISFVALFHFKLDYKYQMEMLTIQIKIEDMLGLTNPSIYQNKHRWKGEALLPLSYYDNHNMGETSDKFVKKMCSVKKTNFYEILYYVFALMGIGIILLGVFY